MSYSFSDLEAGTYCVSIDPRNGSNAEILLPGSWTFPLVTDGTAGATVVLGAGETKFDINFGWDYQFLPSIPQACVEMAKFVTDVTIPDNTQMSRGEKFTKTWRFMNSGKCSWSGYTIASLPVIG